mmetsp:Transcript_14056/g.38622  ORF Transcript_14056/g.38622 Transcript_14056/m.38622 type:complete len:285 (-) Transcript_14056:110-964(-)
MDLRMARSADIDGVMLQHGPQQRFLDGYDAIPHILVCSIVIVGPSALPPFAPPGRFLAMLLLLHQNPCPMCQTVSQDLLFRALPLLLLPRGHVFAILHASASFQNLGRTQQSRHDAGPGLSRDQVMPRQSDIPFAHFAFSVVQQLSIIVAHIIAVVLVVVIFANIIMITSAIRFIFIFICIIILWHSHDRLQPDDEPLALRQRQIETILQRLHNLLLWKCVGFQPREHWVRGLRTILCNDLCYSVGLFQGFAVAFRPQQLRESLDGQNGVAVIDCHGQWVRTEL